MDPDLKEVETLWPGLNTQDQLAAGIGNIGCVHGGFPEVITGWDHARFIDRMKRNQ